MPPSTHASGHSYTWSKLTLAAPPQMPATWLDRLPLLTQRGIRRASEHRQVCSWARQRHCLGRSHDQLPKVIRQSARYLHSTAYSARLPKPGKRVWAAVRRCLITNLGHQP